MSLPDFARILQTWETVRSPLARWLPDGQAEALGQRLHAKSQQIGPRIMIYGVYNAGKSTLLNALAGSEMAAMADRPQTSRITPYAWQGYTLLDTPGIDAPEQHEADARAELERSDVVLFVVASGGGVDEASTWRELVEIVRRARRVMLIVNNKKGLEPCSTEFLQIADKLRANLQAAAQAAGVTGILEQVPIHLVNARTALKGRVDNKPLLVERSGLPELESELAEFLRKSDHYTVLNTCRSDLLAALDSAEMALQQQQGDAQSQALAALRQRMEHERERLATVLGEQLDHLLPEAGSRIAEAIRQATQGKDSDSVEKKIEAAAADIASAVGAHLNAAVELEVRKTQRNLRDIGQVSASELAAAAASVTMESGPGRGPAADPAFEQTLKQTLQALPIGHLAEKGALFALKMGKEQLPELFKGIGAKTMGRWAGAAGKWIGPIVQVAASMWELYQIHQESEAQKRELQRQAMAVEDATNKFVGSLRDGYRRLIADLVDQVFVPLDDWLEKGRKAEHGLQASLTADQLLLTQARLALRADER